MSKENVAEARRVRLPLAQADIDTLRAGERVLLTGVMYTARDAAHKRLCEMLRAGEALPLPKGCCLYYAGACPAAPGEVIGPCGPTTSARMDPYAEALLACGVTGMVGKGPRADDVLAAMAGRAVYFAATGGAGMLLASRVKAARVIAFAELGTEAILELTVEDFPVIVAADARGGDVYRREK